MGIRWRRDVQGRPGAGHLPEDDDVDHDAEAVDLVFLPDLVVLAGLAALPVEDVAGGAPAARKGRRRLVVSRVGNGVMFVGLACGVYALLPRLGGLSHDAAELRHARPAFVAAVVAQAVSLGCYALLYRRVLASLGARCRSG